VKRHRFSDELIIAIVKEQEAGKATPAVCRRHGNSGATFYKWKAKQLLAESVLEIGRP